MLRHSARVCASLATLKARISLLNSDLQKRGSQLTQLANELVQQKVEVIVTSGPRSPSGEDGHGDGTDCFQL